MDETPLSGRMNTIDHIQIYRKCKGEWKCAHPEENRVDEALQTGKVIIIDQMHSSKDGRAKGEWKCAHPEENRVGEAPRRRLPFSLQGGVES